jgi:hypothetical protein
MIDGENNIEEQYANWKVPEESKPLANAERFKSPFFIREQNLEQTLSHLEKIDPAKRKILVYVGFHPNEGTDRLTAQYANQWAEKYGATIVCHPTRETVNAVWGNRQPNDPDGEITQLEDNLTVNQNEYAKKFALDNPNTQVIFLHGTPLRSYNEYKRKYGKEERLKGLEVVAPEHVGLNQVLPAKENKNGITNDLKIEQPDMGEGQYPNSILVEYFYEGQPAKNINGPYVKRLLAMERADYEAAWAAQDRGATGWEPNEDMRLFSKEKHPYQLNLGPGYLVQDEISMADEKTFDEVSVKDLERILEFLANKKV